MNKKIFRLILIAMLIMISSCDASDVKKNATKPVTVVAKMSNNVTHLYYNGIIEPLTTKNVTSSLEGVIKKIYVQYGDWVQEKQKLATLHSSKAQQDYAKELTDYVKDKDDYLRSKNSFAATTTLYNAGIVSKEEYMTEKSQYETTELSYLVAAAALKNKNPLVASTQQDIEKLTLENVDELKKEFEKNYVEVDVYAPITGILLAPGKNNAAGSDSSDKKIVEGNDIKENQILFTIGDMTGITTHIDVSETQINSIQKDQQVTITSWALPGILLQGKVTHVAHQASTSNISQGAANFTVEITVPEITQVQRNLIRVGMTVKIDIGVSHPPAIQLPIQAVTQKNGIDYVTLLDTKTNQQRAVPVVVGDTNVTQVAILSGIKPGDTILVTP